MEWIFNERPEAPRSIWIALREGHAVIPGVFARIDDLPIPAYADINLNEVTDAYAWMPRQEGDEPPLTPYSNRHFPQRCPSGSEHEWMSAGEDEETPVSPDSPVTCALCGTEGPRALTQQRVVPT